MNCYTVSRRQIRPGIEGNQGGIILGGWFRRGDRTLVIPFDPHEPPTAEKGRVILARPMRVSGRIILTNANLTTTALVRIEASEVISQNLNARIVAKATCYGRRDTHQPPQCDVLVWLEEGGGGIISFGSWRHRQMLVNRRGKLTLERFNPNR